jgi:hypothetical protein
VRPQAKSQCMEASSRKYFPKFRRNFFSPSLSLSLNFRRNFLPLVEQYSYILFVPILSPDPPHFLQLRLSPRSQLLMHILQHSWYACRFHISQPIYPLRVPAVSNLLISNHSHLSIYLSIDLVQEFWQCSPSHHCFSISLQPSYIIVSLCLVDYPRVLDLPFDCPGLLNLAF